MIIHQIATTVNRTEGIRSAIRRCELSLQMPFPMSLAHGLAPGHCERSAASSQTKQASLPQATAVRWDFRFAVLSATATL